MRRERMNGFSEECIEVFLRDQSQLFDEPVAETPEEAEAFLEDCMAVVLDSLEEVKEYLEESGADVDGMTLQEIEDASEVFVLPEGKYQAVVQTTFSENELASIRDKGRIEPLNTICMASEERRKALRTIIGDVDAIVVVGDSISANTMELVSISRSYGKPTFLISSDADIDEELFCYNRIGLTAGASAPDSLVDAVRRKIEEHG